MHPLCSIQHNEIGKRAEIKLRANLINRAPVFGIADRYSVRICLGSRTFVRRQFSERRA
jgi:hypothetical protein